MVAATAPHARMEDHIIIARRVVDDDNSCLFTAVAYIMEGFRSKGPQLRCISSLLLTPRLPAAPKLHES